jgi:ParB family chromosome partitioning protein
VAAYRKREAAKNTAAVSQSLTNEWYTPAAYIESARHVLGGFDLDPASCAEANETVRAAQFYSEDDPGLDHEWKGRVWLNPPYGRLAGDFIAYLVGQYHAGHVTAAIALVNAHCTDTAWFRPLWDHVLCFTYGRLNFAAGTARRGGSTHGSVFAYLGPDPAKFAIEFERYGAIVWRFQ